MPAYLAIYIEACSCFNQGSQTVCHWLVCPCLGKSVVASRECLITSCTRIRCSRSNSLGGSIQRGSSLQRCLVLRPLHLFSFYIESSLAPYCVLLHQSLLNSFCMPCEKTASPDCRGYQLHVLLSASASAMWSNKSRSVLSG